MAFVVGKWMVWLESTTGKYFRLVMAMTMDDASFIGMEMAKREKPSAKFMGVTPFVETELEKIGAGQGN